MGRIKTYILLALSLGILLTPLHAGAGRAGKRQVKRPLYVSFINLIATPEKYYGKRIRVTGFAHIEFEWTYLHMSENDARYKVMTNSLELAVTVDPRDKYKDVNKKYVEVVGVFDEHGGLQGRIKDIEKIEKLPNWFKDD